MVFRIFVATMLIALGLLAYVLTRPESLPVNEVRVGQNGMQLTMYLSLCASNGEIWAELDEYDDRVEVRIDGNFSNSDCTSSVDVALSEPLRNRIVVVASSPHRTFEFCGSDSLCRS